MTNALERIASINDLCKAARHRLPRQVFDFLDGGAGDEQTVGENLGAFRAYRFSPRVGVDVSQRHLKTSTLGVESALPFGLAPIGLSGLLHKDGELLAAQAAAEAQIPFCLSTLSCAALEDVARIAPRQDKWFQLYVLKDKEFLKSLIQRASDAKYRVLCVTVDLPTAGRRNRDVRNGFSVPLKPTPGSVYDMLSHPRWLSGMLQKPVTFGNFTNPGSAQGFTSLAKHIENLFDPSADWDDIARLRDTWKGPMILKGVLHPADAEKAQTLGMNGVSVSNHGGRQLDGSPAALDALPDICAAAGDMEVSLDGGVRRGTDIVKAYALGANFVLIGRAFAYGLAAAGGLGVAKAINLLRDEIDNALTLLGVQSIGQIGQEHLWNAKSRVT